MSHYLVTWEIDAWGETPVEAAQRAYEHMRRIDSQACVMSVHDESGNQTQVDLLDLAEQGKISLSEADPARAVFRSIQSKLGLMNDGENVRAFIDELQRRCESA